MARKTKQQALETRQHILDVAMRLFSQQGVSATSLAQIAQAAGVTRGAIYWHFKDKSDLFGEIWELSESSISDLESEYRAKFPHDPLSVLREILVYILEATVVEERRRLMMEIIFHKCEFVGEMAVVQQAQRDLCLESYDRIEQVLTECMQAKMLPATLLTRRAAILMRSYISGLMENWLFAPESFDLKSEARSYVEIFLELRLNLSTRGSVTAVVCTGIRKRCGCKVKQQDQENGQNRMLRAIGVQHSLECDVRNDRK